MELPFKRYLNIFKLPEERHRRVLEQIKENAKPDLDYFTLTIFAGIIITLGLIINNSSVIIGGMLMAPLVWPILALALAMIKGSLRLFETSIITLVKSAVLILIASYLIGLISPFNEFGVEFLSRTQPTLIELFIALASGFVAAFVIGYPALGSFIAGVVIASAVVPPLCVTGLSLAEQNLALSAGSLLLFISNLIAMILSAALFFGLAKFKPLTSEASLERRKNNVTWSVIFLIIIIIPLAIITSDVIKNEKRTSIINETIVAKVNDSEISDINIKNHEDVLFIEVTIRAKNNLSPRQMDQLTTSLSKELGQSVNLKLTIIPVLEGGQVYQVEEPQTNINVQKVNINSDEVENIFPQVK